MPRHNQAIDVSDDGEFGPPIVKGELLAARGRRGNMRGVRRGASIGPPRGPPRRPIARGFVPPSQQRVVQDVRHAEIAESSPSSPLGPGDSVMSGESDDQSPNGRFPTRGHQTAPIHRNDEFAESRSHVLRPATLHRCDSSVDLHDEDNSQSHPIRPQARGLRLGLAGSQEAGQQGPLKGRGTLRRGLGSSDDSDFEDNPSKHARRGASLFVRDEPRPRTGAAMLVPGLQKEQPAGFDLSAPPVGVLSESHRLKAALDLMHHSPAILGRPRKGMVELDPENHMIKHMRQDLKMPWGEIKDEMNAKRAKEGRPQTFTEAAVYGRFVRNGKRIAEANGEVFNPADYMHLKPSERAASPASRNPQNTGSTPSTNATWTEDKKIALVEAVREVNESFWRLVANTLEDRLDIKFEPEELQKKWMTI